MINDIIISRIDSAMNGGFLKKHEINKVISLLDPEYLDPFYNNYVYNLGIKATWDYFIFYDVQHRTNYIEYPGPQKDHVQRLIGIFSQIINCPERINLLIHCTAGISRSTAATYILLYLIHKDKQIALDKLLEIRTIANPNLLLLEYADEILGTDLKQFVGDWVVSEGRKKVLLEMPKQNY